MHLTITRSQRYQPDLIPSFVVATTSSAQALSARFPVAIRLDCALLKFPTKVGDSLPGKHS